LQEYDPGHFLAWDRHTHAIVLAFRGTFDPLDLLADLNTAVDTFGEGITHRHDAFTMAVHVT
jgi:hypothetical protein